jgi:predicted transcriptional regulator of viral defense system
MRKKNFILELYRAKNSVFTFKEISLLLNETNRDALKAKVNYYVKKGDINQVRRGIYVKPEYDKFELAVKIYMPSYISLETILQEAGIIFQHYERIFVVSYLTRLITVDGQDIMLRKIKNDILLNSSGIIISGNYAKASKERAFLDCLYLYRNYHFDNLEALDKDKVFELADIYHNKQLLKKVRGLIE